MISTNNVLQSSLAALLLCFATCVNSHTTYDFIVVGAGAGGSAVAMRLVENNASFSVLLIEAGGLPPQGYDVPARAQTLWNDPQIIYRFQSQPLRNAGLINNGVASLVSGKMLGGTTSLNYMWFNRGNSRDWDNWADVTGDYSWRYENMLRYFKRSENYEGDFSSKEHGYGGPITVSRPRYAPGLDIWLRAGRELGYSVGDPNGAEQPGFSPVEFSKKRGRRDSSLTGYLAPVLDKPNLYILLNTTVTKIIFRGKKAVGVEIISNSTRFPPSPHNSNIFYATKEIIISAGTYNSPLILQRSGIGPRHVLQPANIPVIAELPTGNNFQEHAAMNLNFAINNASVVMDEERDLTTDNWQLFKLFGDGPFSSTRGGTGQSMLVSSVAAAEGNSEWPDTQLIMGHSTLPWYSADGLHLSARRFLKRGEVPISMAIYVGRPKSRGSVRINSTNILGTPIVDLGLLTDSRDEQIMLEGIYQSLRVYEQTKAYSFLNPRFTPVALPACDHFVVRSEDYWRCYIRQATLAGCHPVGTNKMGRHTDPTAVVDSELRVLGIESLRVVDASVMPFLVNANPQAPVYAIAEKAAESILKRWQQAASLGWSEYNGNSFRYSNKDPQHISYSHYNQKYA